MHPTLQAVLAAFGVYALIGLLPIAVCYREPSRTNKLICGFFLIYLAAFVLTGLALVTGVVQDTTIAKKWSDEESAQVKSFMQYIIFFGAVFSLFYGSVGANLFSSALTDRREAELQSTLQRIERKIDGLSLLLSLTYKNTNALLVIVCIGAAIGLGLLWWIAAK